MTISVSERVALTCTACATPFETDAWVILDAAEEPERVQELFDGRLNLAICPNCGASNQEQVAMLYHDAVLRRVHFAVPAGADEFRWRERAQELLRVLVSQIPEEAQLAYLGDVQVNQEIDGIRRALLKRQRVRAAGTQPSFGKPIPMPESLATMPPLKVRPPSPALSPKPPAPALTTAIEEVLAVSSVDELQALVRHYPQLLGTDTDEILRELAEQAFNQGDRDTATAIHGARRLLADVRAGREVSSSSAAAVAVPDTVLPEPSARGLPEPAYQALLQTAADPALMDAIRLFPVLLEPWSDDAVGARVEAALDEGNERLATVIEDRRDALAALRAMLLDNAALGGAIDVLLTASDTDAVERALRDHPALLTAVAQQALTAYAEQARARGDDRNAEIAEERRTMLQQVRAGVSD